MEELLQGGKLCTWIDEQIVFSQLDDRSDAIWSLFLASGYLRLESYQIDEDSGKETYELMLTNKEVRLMFQKLIESWFSRTSCSYNDFIYALLQNDIKSMNSYMNDIVLATFSYFVVRHK